jgi:hypothetical protein
MLFISAQPDTDYFIWQLEVQYHNFSKYGFEKDMIILFGYKKENGVNEKAKIFANKVNARVFFIDDTREDTTYISSIRPHLLKKYFKYYDVDEPFLYHDSDIIFISKPNFNTILNCKKCKGVYLSDTISYIGANYIKSKGDDLLHEMCKIVEINPQIVINNENNSGGAQYLFKHIVDFKFWEKVEKDSIGLFKHMQNTLTKYSPDHPIQSWCADMWAVLWNIWYINVETKIRKELDFTWSTYHIDPANKASILHNAGVLNTMNNMFYKGNYYNKSPFNDDLSFVDSNYNSYLYVKEIIETGIYNKINQVI